MRKTSLFVIAAATLMIGLGGWAASMPHGRVAESASLRIDAIQATIDTKTLPAQHYDDYSRCVLIATRVRPVAPCAGRGNQRSARVEHHLPPKLAQRAQWNFPEELKISRASGTGSYIRGRLKSGLIAGCTLTGPHCGVKCDVGSTAFVSGEKPAEAR